MRFPLKKQNGFTLLELVTVVAIVTLLAGLLASGVQKVRAASARASCQNNLRQLVLGLHNYHQTAGVFPPGASPNVATEPQPYLFWCARLLPYLDQEALWSQTIAAFEQERNFQEVPPHYGLQTPVHVFNCPSDSRVASAQSLRAPGRTTPVLRGFTSYLGNIGYNSGRTTGILYMSSTVRMADVTDGLSNTLIIGERPPSADFVMGWWYAGWGQNHTGETDALLGVRTRNLDIYAPGCPRGPYAYEAGSFENMCSAFHFWSPHAAGANFAFADGSVRLLTYDSNPIMPDLASRAGGEAVETPE